jgi:hypothetical protein
MLLLGSACLQWHDLPAEFHENLPSSKKFISGEADTDRETAW